MSLATTTAASRAPIVARANVASSAAPQAAAPPPLPPPPPPADETQPADQGAGGGCRWWLGVFGWWQTILDPFVVHAATWTVLNHDGPNHLGLCANQTILDPFVYASVVGALSPVFRADILTWCPLPPPISDACPCCLPIKVCLPSSSCLSCPALPRPSPCAPASVQAAPRPPCGRVVVLCVCVDMMLLCVALCVC